MITRVLDHHPAEDHDLRSIQRFHIARMVTDVPTKGRYWTPPRWRLDQGNTGHCGGMAATNEGGASPYRLKLRDPLAEAHRFYYDAKDWQLDPWGREDGTSTLAMMKVGQRLGWWDNYAWAANTDDLKRHLTVGPFLFGIPYRTHMFDPNGDGWVEATGADEGGHLMCAYGPTLHLVQSWGDFGWKGLIRMSMDGAADLLANGEAGAPVGRHMVAA
jgi:hypothetical protein